MAGEAQIEPFDVDVPDADLEDLRRRLTDRAGGVDRREFRAWSDCGGDVERSFSKDQLLTTTGTLGASAAVPSVH